MIVYTYPAVGSIFHWLSRNCHRTAFGLITKEMFVCPEKLIFTD
jgi:hypothetical protein